MEVAVSLTVSLPLRIYHGSTSLSCWIRSYSLWKSAEVWERSRNNVRRLRCRDGQYLKTFLKIFIKTVTGSRCFLMPLYRLLAHHSDARFWRYPIPFAFSRYFDQKALCPNISFDGTRQQLNSVAMAKMCRREGAFPKIHKVCWFRKLTWINSEK